MATTSPSDSVIYAVHILNKQNAGSGMGAAVKCAFKRIRELVENPVHKQNHLPTFLSTRPHFKGNLNIKITVTIFQIELSFIELIFLDIL